MFIYDTYVFIEAKNPKRWSFYNLSTSKWFYKNSYFSDKIIIFSIRVYNFVTTLVIVTLCFSFSLLIGGISLIEIEDFWNISPRRSKSNPLRRFVFLLPLSPLSWLKFFIRVSLFRTLETLGKAGNTALRGTPWQRYYSRRRY